ncbi:hypothetical protein S245_024565, partial [Arachis hypogaea]
FLKTKVRDLSCLYLPVPHAFKIVETDASNLGYNSTQQNYSTIKKEILAIVLCITKFQSDLLNQKFLVRLDCKSAKDILQNDVKNLASKQIFASTSRVTQTLSLTFSHVNICRETSKVTIMPKKATLASVRGRGVRLALQGPIKKLGSSTPTGSSTQQSTKKSSKSPAQQTIEPTINQSKQTKADYAFPIETLL